jgi:hypothetical protein
MAKVKFNPKGEQVKVEDQKESEKVAVCSQCKKVIGKYDYTVDDMHSKCFTELIAKKRGGGWKERSVKCSK